MLRPHGSLLSFSFLSETKIGAIRLVRYRAQFEHGSIVFAFSLAAGDLIYDIDFEEGS